MVTAFVLMNIERGKINEVAQRALGIEGIAEVFSVAGEFDLIAILRTASNEQIADIVTGHLLDIPYIVRSETMLAFRAFSKDDLGAAFALGSDEPALRE